MIKKRLITKRLNKAIENLNDARKYHSASDIDICKAINVLKETKQAEGKRARNTDKTSGIFKRRGNLQYIKVIREDLKFLCIDAKHNNIKSVENWAKEIRKVLTTMNRLERNSIRNGDLGMNKMVEKIRGC